MISSNIGKSIGLWVAAAMASGSAFAGTYTIDSKHTTVEFRVRHMMVSTVSGTFSDVQGTIVYDENNLDAAKIDVAIAAASINTNEKDRDEHLRGADFLDAANHPTIEFHSKLIARDSTGTGLEAVGDVTIRGITKPVTLQITELTPSITDPWGFVRRGAHATATLKRSDFGIVWNKTLDAGGVAVSDEVQVGIDLELVEQKAAPAAPPAGKDSKSGSKKK